MPILNIRALPQKNPDRIQFALKETCKAIAEIYECEPEQVWATWTEIKPGLYVEGGLSVDEQPEDTHPPIAELLCFEGCEEEEIERLLKTAASTLSRSLGIEDNVFMTFSEAQSGRVIAGNGVIRNSHPGDE